MEVMGFTKNRTEAFLMDCIIYPIVSGGIHVVLEILLSLGGGRSEPPYRVTMRWSIIKADSVV